MQECIPDHVLSPSAVLSEGEKISTLPHDQVNSFQISSMTFKSGPGSALSVSLGVNSAALGCPYPEHSKGLQTWPLDSSRNITSEPLNILLNESLSACLGSLQTVYTNNGI